MMNAASREYFSICGELRSGFELGKRCFIFNCMFCGEQFDDLQEFSHHLDVKHMQETSNSFPKVGYEITEKAFYINNLLI